MTNDHRTIAEQSRMSHDEELFDWYTRAGLPVPPAVARVVVAKKKKPARSTRERRASTRKGVKG